MADPLVWGQLKLCVPKESLLQNKKHQRQAGQAEAEQPCLDSCQVMPMFCSSEASYSHPVGSAMRHSFQAARKWKQTARDVWQLISSSLYQQLMHQQHASARHAVPAPSPQAAPSPAPPSNILGVA
eukprot:1136942-Pelagomonas_calceolata.AAC.1